MFKIEVRTNRGKNRVKIEKRFEVEKKVSEVRFEGIHVGPYISVMEKVLGHAFLEAFKEKEIIWILE